MLSGSAFLRVILLLIAAAVIAGLVQHYWMHDGGLPETPLVETPKPARPNGATRRDEAAMRRPAEAPAPQPPPPPAPPPSEPAPAAPPQGAADAPRETALAPSPAPEPPAPPQETAAPAEPPSAPPPAGADVAETDATQTADPSATEPVDLNTGTLAQLNSLKGGGAIGRAIIQRRPYTSVDQLLTKRVLSRSTYQKIKDQVTVR